MPINSLSTKNEEFNVNAALKPKGSCYFCGGARHNRQQCPARDAICNDCGKIGHFAKVCKSRSKSSKSSSASLPAVNSTSSIPTVAASPQRLQNAVIPLIVRGRKLDALIDTGSSDSFICKDKVKELDLETMPSNSTVSMAQSSLKAGILGYVTVDISINEHDYRNQKLAVLDKLCTDVVIGQDILRQHESLDLVFGGNRATLTICGLTTVLVKPPALFANLKSDCKPVAIKSRRYSKADRDFVEIEIQRLLKEDIIEPSSSPWRAQVVVTANERHKKRMVIDYSQTINRFTNLDAYPLPRIDEQINEIAKNRVFSAIDLKDAYYQISLRNKEKCFTAFEAVSKLYQYKRIPFGVTNGVACFQRVMDEFISNNKLHGICAYLDNLAVCGRDQDEHDANLSRFLDAAKKHNLKFNGQKCTICTTSIKLLGYEVNNGEIRPDPDRLQPLRDIPLPQNLSAQKKVMELFAYYSKWIRGFSGKIKPLASNTSFPMPQFTLNAFQQLKKEIKECVVCDIDESLPFTIETDASEQAIAATLNQGGRPVAFFSRSLQKS